MKTMYKAFEFQFTESFRKTAKQPEPERSPSPSLSECVSEAVSSSDRASQHSRQRQRRTSVMRMVSKDDRQRKSSSAVMKDRRKNSQLTPNTLKASLGSMDSSSTESINSSQKHKDKTRRLSSNTGLAEQHEDLSDISSISHSERRPQKVTTHGSIPVVKEPKAMRAIRE